MVNGYARRRIPMRREGLSMPEHYRLSPRPGAPAAGSLMLPPSCRFMRGRPGWRQPTDPVLGCRCGMSFVESRVCLRLFKVLARMIRQGLFRGQAYVLGQCGHLRCGGGGPRIRGEDGSCRHDRQVPPLMLSRGAAAMDTFDFALRCDPMASRLTHPTGSRSGPSGITSRRDARGCVSLAQARTDHQLRR